MTRLQEIKRNMQAAGWGGAELDARANEFARGERISRHAATGLSNGDCVGIRLASGRLAVGIVRDGLLGVDGGIGSDVRERLTLPWQRRGPELWLCRAGDTIAVLADGTEVKLHAQDRGVWSCVAGGRVFASVLDAAVALTPYAA